MDFTSKVIVMTGGASGIGQAAAREFAARNGAVAVFDRGAHGRSIRNLSNRGAIARLMIFDLES